MALTEIFILFFIVCVTMNYSKVILRDARQCIKDKEYVYGLKGKIKQVNGKNLVYGNLTMYKVLKNEYLYLVTIDKVTGSTSKRVMTLSGRGACKALSQYGGKTFYDLAKYAEFKNPEKCPLEMYHNHVLTFNGYHVPINNVPITRLAPKGVYKIFIKAFEENIELACFIISAEVI